MTIFYSHKYTKIDVLPAELARNETDILNLTGISDPLLQREKHRQLYAITRHP